MSFIALTYLFNFFSCEFGLSMFFTGYVLNIITAFSVVRVLNIIRLTSEIEMRRIDATPIITVMIDLSPFKLMTFHLYHYAVGIARGAINRNLTITTSSNVRLPFPAIFFISLLYLLPKSFG